MIDWILTKAQLGEVGPLRFNPYVIKVCQGCGVAEKRRYNSGRKRPTAPYYCRKCVLARPEVKAKQRKRTLEQWEEPGFREQVVANSKKNWLDPERRQKMSKVDTDPIYLERLRERNRTMKDNPAWCRAVSISSKKNWQDAEYRSKLITHIKDRALRQWTDPAYRRKVAEANATKWREAEYRAQVAVALQQKWSEPEFIAKMAKIMGSDEYRGKISVSMKKRWEENEYRRLMQMVPKVSSIQQMFYSVLDDLKIAYFKERNDGSDDKECLIGPYSFDCVVPRKDKKTLLIEVNGDWIHSRPDRVSRDAAKASYVNNNLSDRYELKYVWEHEFSCPDRVVSTVKHWLGLSDLKTVDFDLNSVQIRDCEAKDYRTLLSKYHYLANAGRGGIAFGAYLGDVLIAVCVFSPLVRQNIPQDHQTTRELSRLCIHPSYQKKNFASWFISRCIKQLNPVYKTVISYCDTTYNHDGAVYKAVNFRLDGEVKPDYWYVAEDGWVMHKKTLYNHAVNTKLTEREYSEKFGYQKVWGKKKLRFIFIR